MAGRNHQAVMREAAALFAGRLSGSTTQAQIDEWASASDAHAVALARVESAWERAERLKALPEAPPVRREDWPTRRWAAGLAAGVVGAGALGAGGWIVGVRGQERTGVGERRTVRLDDGSRVELNTDSRIRVEYTDAERRIHLTRGEALFDVAKDPRRPFIVAAGDARVRAIGTAFNVRLRDKVVELTVTEGVVSVDGRTEPRPQASAPPAAPKVKAGQVAIIASGAVAAAPVEGDVVRRRLAWRDGAIELEGETLEQAVAEFNRYNRHKLVIADPQVAALRVGGRFGAQDVDGFLTAVQDSFEVRAVPGEQDATYLVRG